MELNIEERSDGVTRAALAGRMDIEGAQSVEMRMNVLSGLKRRLVIDLSEVTFMASMGLRALMICARQQGALGGHVALAGPQPGVAKVLDESGIGDLIGVYPTVDAAAAAVSG